MIRKLSLLILLAAAVPACAHSRSPFAAADTSLKLQRVVLYRNGIGYFERAGDVDGDMLRIKVRRDQINDLLKSLTVIDRNSGTALSVSMPLDPQSWAGAALASLEPGRGNLAEVLDGLRGTEVVLKTSLGRVRGRIAMVERIVNEPDPEGRGSSRGGAARAEQSIDHKVTVVDGAQLRVVRLSKVRGLTLVDKDIALQLNRSLDASAGEGMFQQVEVAIRLGGKKRHDLVVSYVVEAPMWKPTYRVVLPKAGEGKALLQAWAVVDNTSGEDWRDVSMSLTSGEPIAFQYDLHTPRNVTRTDLTEASVHRRARVALGETTFVDEEEGDDLNYEPAPEVVVSAKAEPMGGSSVRSRGKPNKQGKKKGKSRKIAENSRDKAKDRWGGSVAMDGPAPASPPPAMDFDALRRSTQAQARASQVSGMTRFDLQAQVTVPNGTSTMVAILNEEVEAEETFLYKPGGAGFGYDANPYRVVRFKNSTAFVLEPGPISIYSGGSFVGEGLSSAVGTHTSATIPFAVEPSIMVSSSHKRTGEDMRLVRIVRGVLEVETFSRTETTWNVRGPRQAKSWSVLVRHPKAGSNYELLERPNDTEDLPDAYLVRVLVPQNKTEGKLTLTEQTPSRMTLSIWDGRATKVLEKLLLHADVTPAMRKQIEPIVVLRQAIGRIDTEVSGMKTQQYEFDQRARETRANLEALKKDRAAGALRRKLSARLDDFTRGGDKLGRKIIELQSKRLEKKIELEDMLQDLDFSAPKAKKNKTKK